MNTIALLLPDFALILLGSLLCRHTALNRSVWGQVELVVYFVLFPVLLFYSIVRRPIDLGAAGRFVASGWLVALLAIGLSYALPWLLGKRIDPREHAASAQVGFRVNSFIGLALVQRLAGDHGLATFSILVGVCVPLFNVAAVWPMARHSQQGVWRALVHNPLIWATGGGLALNLLGFTVPPWAEPTVARVGQSSLVLGLLTAGASMQLARLAHDKLLGASVLTIRHLVTPLMAWAVARALNLDTEQTLALLVFGSVPTASSCHVLAGRMGYDGSYVAGLVTLSTLLGMASLPLALNVLMPL